jgi:DNA-binding MarR family transcriptional regulator
MGKWSNITGRTGKGAFAIRSMLDFMPDEAGQLVHLRDVQSAALDGARNLEGDISLQYVKNLIKELEQRGIWKKKQQGRKWFLSLTPDGVDLKEFINKLSWGLELQSALTAEDDHEKELAWDKWVRNYNIVRGSDERERIENSELWRLHKVGMVNFLTYNPNTKIAKQHPKHPDIWIIRPLRDGEEPE